MGHEPPTNTGDYSRSPKNPTLQLFQKSSKSACTTPQRLIWNTFGTVTVWDFWENGRIDQKVALSGVSLLHMLPLLGRYDRRPVNGRHVASPIENLRIGLLHC